MSQRTSTRGESSLASCHVCWCVVTFPSVNGTGTAMAAACSEIARSIVLAC